MLVNTPAAIVGSASASRSSALGRELHPLLLLALIAEPHADHVLFQVQLLGNGGDFLARRPRLNGKVGLEAPLLGGRDGGPLPLLFARRQHSAISQQTLVDPALAPKSVIRVLNSKCKRKRLVNSNLFFIYFIYFHFVLKK